MIVAEFTRPDSDKLRVRVRGHSTYAPRGEDVVCAAVSGIMYSLVGFLKGFRRDEILGVEIKSGHVDIVCSSTCEELIKMICVGLAQIALTYPEQVSVKNQVWRWMFGKE